MRIDGRQRSRTLAGVCFLIIAGLFACTGVKQQEVKQEVKRDTIPVTILFFNDIHGHLLPTNEKAGNEGAAMGGVGRLAALVSEIREENEKTGRKTFVFIAGDILQGTPMSTIFRGEPDIKVFNAMGVDAMTVGNHEFDFGMNNFLSLKQQAKFPFLSANIRSKSTRQLICDAQADFPLSGDLALTVIGVTTRELLVSTRPENVAGLTVDESVASVRQALESRKKRGPVILLSHSKHRTDREIASALPGLDAIIAGHDHLLFSPYRQVNGVPIFEALDNGRYLGRIDLAVDPLTGKATIESTAYLPVTAAIEETEEIEYIVARYSRRLLYKSYGKKIGQAEVFLDGRREDVRYEETALGNFVTDVMRQYTGCEIALVNSGALRDSIPPGRILLRKVFDVLPFDNDIVRVDLTGEKIMAALERSVRGDRDDQDGGFLQVSGIRFTIHGHKAVNVRVGPEDSPLDPERTYSVALTDFIATGGDGYQGIFESETAINTRLPLREVVIDAIRGLGTISAEKENRIVRNDAP